MGAVIGTAHMSDDTYADVGPNIFTIDQDFASGDLTGFLLSSLGGDTYTYGGTFLDEGVSVYFVNAKDEFSETNILGGAFTEVALSAEFTLPQNFFLGIRTPAVGFDVVQFPPAFGWAEFENMGTGELSLVDHAVVYGGQGVIVDTVTPIPEPSSLTLGSIALTLLFKRRRRRTKRWRSTPLALGVCF